MTEEELILLEQLLRDSKQILALVKSVYGTHLPDIVFQLEKSIKEMEEIKKYEQ